MSRAEILEKGMAAMYQHRHRPRAIAYVSLSQQTQLNTAFISPYGLCVTLSQVPSSEDHQSLSFLNYLRHYDCDYDANPLPEQEHDSPTVVRGSSNFM